MEYELQAPQTERNYLWYEECLGISSNEVMAYDTTHFSPAKTTIVRQFQVPNLEGLLTTLAAKGVAIDNNIEENSHGLFAWVYDPEGNQVELWEPRNQFRDSLVNIPEAE